MARAEILPDTGSVEIAAFCGGVNKDRPGSCRTPAGMAVSRRRCYWYRLLILPQLVSSVGFG